MRLPCVDNLVHILQCNQHLVLQHTTVARDASLSAVAISQQQADETPMVWSILAWTYLLWEADIRRVSPLLAKALVPLMVIYGAVFAALHWHYRWVIGFQLHFAAFVFGDLVRFLRHWREHPDPQAAVLAAGYVNLGFVGFSLWMMDQHMCETMHNLPINPQVWMQRCMN